VSNVTQEVARARVVCSAGLNADRLRRKIEPAGHNMAVPPGLDPCDVPANVLKDYLLATKQVDFNALAAKEQRAQLSPGKELAAAIDAQSLEGSNNWVIAPSLSATGRPILANDPHRQLGAPSLRYLVGLSARGSTSSVRASPRCRAFRSDTTMTSPSASRYSRSTKRTCGVMSWAGQIPTATAIKWLGTDESGSRED
jgi:hypothetical protein